MIKIFQNKSVLDMNINEDSIIFAPSNELYNIKEKFINKDILITTVDNYISKIVNKKIVGDIESYIYMFLAFNNTKKNIDKYNVIEDISFIKSLVSTYSFFKENKLKENNKIKSLKEIFREYEKIVNSFGYITKYQMYDLLDVKLIGKKNIYFENIRELNFYEIDFINKIKDIKNVFIFANTINNLSLIEELNKICDVKYEQTENNDVNNLFEIGSNNLFDGIKLVSCNDLYEEIKYISNDIKLNINNGMKFNDILVISSDINRYDTYFKELFDFPYQRKQSYGILTKNFIEVLTNIIKGDFSCRNFISLLKLKLINISDDVINDLDNYVYMWNLEDSLFYEEFIFNPMGKKDFSENDYKKLDKLNEARISILNPIRYLISNIVGEVNTSSILRNIFTYIDEEEITNNLSLKDNEGYMKFVNLLEIINDNISKININDLLDILNLLYDSFDKSINMKDEVAISNLNDYVSNNYKKVYFIGLTEKDLPSKFKFVTLINDNDLEDEEIFTLMKKKTNKEQNIISNILLNKDVILTYHKLNDSKAKVGPSVILSKVASDNISYTYELYKKENNNMNLKLDSSLASLLYGNNLVLSPSSLEMFAKCKYSYFLSYGLKLNIKEKMMFDNREVGTFVHYILENCIKENVNSKTKDKLIDKYTKEYFSINLRNINSKDLYVIEELKESLKILIEVILEELSNTKFKPKYTELKIKDMPFVIKLDNGEIKITGIVDRVDTHEDENNFYYRIIDYKTGIKKFRLDDILNGLNMQMLIYLIAIRNSNISNKNIVPTGFLYYPALVHYRKENINITEEEIINNLKESLKMNGILNKDNLELYNDNVGEYIDVTTRGKINEGKVLSSSDLELVFDKVIRVLKKEGNNMLSGDISINPIIDSKNDSCKYCKFNSICKFDSEKNKPRRFKSIKNSEVIRSIEGEINGLDI